MRLMLSFPRSRLVVSLSLSLSLSLYRQWRLLIEWPVLALPVTPGLGLCTEMAERTKPGRGCSCSDDAFCERKQIAETVVSGSKIAPVDFSFF